MKPDEITFLMGVAKLAAARSKATRLKVGSVVTDSLGNMVASGYNGTIRGYTTNSCEDLIDGKLVTDDSRTIHAEQNLIAHAARRGTSINGGTVVLTHSPCPKCASLLIQCGITEIIYEKEHSSFEKTVDMYSNFVTLTKYKEQT